MAEYAGEGLLSEFAKRLCKVAFTLRVLRLGERHRDHLNDHGIMAPAPGGGDTAWTSVRLRWCYLWMDTETR